MNLEQWLLLIAVGGLCGLLGQGVRVIIGLKKLKDANDDHKIAAAAAHAAGQPEPPPPDPFSGAFLLTSLLIGFVAGALAAIGMAAAATADALKAMCQPDKPYCVLDAQTVVAFVAAGFAGTDAIEAFMGKWLPK